MGPRGSPSGRSHQGTRLAGLTREAATRQTRRIANWPNGETNNQILPAAPSRAATLHDHADPPNRRCQISRRCEKCGLVHEHFERDGRTAEIERLLVYTVRDGLFCECWVYDQDQTLVDVFLA
jgi:hypothetical protein